VDAHGLFDIAEPKVFAPTLAAGDRLRFMLRANATVSRGNGTDQRGKVEDVVMHALHGLTTVERRVQRLAVVASAGLAWLDKRGSDGGFTIDLPACRVDAHRVLSIPHGRTPVRLGIMDFEGTLRIDDPERFLAAVRAGFGRGKAFGNGLMLIRRE
jgi:CRISPR system Cascade subunit CasE